MSVIRLTVDGQKLIPVEKPLIASQGVVEDSVIFDFSSEWDGFGKVALFWRAEDEQREDIYEVMVDENSTALVPWEVTQTDGEICITVFGTQDTSVITAEIIRYKIVEGLYSEGQGSEPPTPDIYQQILAIAGEVNGKFDVMSSRVDQIVASTTEINDGHNVIILMREYNVTHQAVEADWYWTRSFAMTPAPGMDDYPNAILLDAWYATNWDINDVFDFSETGIGHGLYDNEFLHHHDNKIISATAEGSGLLHVYSNFDGSINPPSGYSGGKLRWYIALQYTTSVDLSELTDIRVGVDSTTYTSAGAAVRAQINHLQDEIDELGS